MDYLTQYVEEISQDILTILSTQPTSIGELISYLNGPTHNQNTDIKINVIEDVFDSLANEGYEINSIVNDKNVEEFFHIPYETYNKNGDNSISFGLISDTHCGAEKCDMDALNQYYDIINERDIKTVFHCGDMISGTNMYKTHYEDNSVATLSKQCSYVVKHYPKIHGGQTVFVTGNHDLRLLKYQEGYKQNIDTGAKIEKMALQSGREDLVYIGACIGRAVIDKQGNVLKLTHKVNKQDYEFSNHGKEDYILINDSAKHLKIIAEGHSHKTCYEMEKNNGDITHKFGCGTFLRPSESYLKRGIFTPLSGWIVNINYDDNGRMTLLPEPIYFE